MNGVARLVPRRWLTVGPLLALACEAQVLSIGDGPPLVLDDVQSLPAGDATGSDASGGYLFTDFSITRCQCRDGSAQAFGCALPWALGADGLWLDQDGGTLTATPVRDGALQGQFALRGGIDDGGHFEVGAAFDIVDFDSAAGQAYDLAFGVVVPQASIDMQWTTRAQFLADDEAFDCDIDADFALVWWSPDAQGQCSQSAQCHPSRPFCVRGACSAGDDGSPCDFPSDCQSAVCGPDGRCERDGACGLAQPCGPEAPICYEAQCQLGGEGDPCGDPLDCAFAHHCVQGECYDGSAGDPCVVTTDCDLGQGLACGPDMVCG